MGLVILSRQNRRSERRGIRAKFFLWFTLEIEKPPPFDGGLFEGLLQPQREGTWSLYRTPWPGPWLTRRQAQPKFLNLVKHNRIEGRYGQILTIPPLSLHSDYF